MGGIPRSSSFTARRAVAGRTGRLVAGVIVADYRGGNMNPTSSPPSTGLITSIDDGLAVIDSVEGRPLRRSGAAESLCVSLGGNLVMILTPGPPAGPDRFRNVKRDPEVQGKNTPTDILALIEGTLPQHRVTKLSTRPAGPDQLSKIFEEPMVAW